MGESKRPGFSTDRRGDSVRRRHGLHFNDCEAMGLHSAIYIDYLCRDIEPCLLEVVRELETRASMVLAGEPRRRVLELLYDWQDYDPNGLVMFFIQCSDAESPLQLGFGHVGSGHMGVVDPDLWERQLGEFRENIWITVVSRSRKKARRDFGG